jgi:type IV pilus assembly protein PilE
MSMFRQRSAGFSLIELMVVVAIIGIIAAIAVPSYNQYVERSRCSQAEADLLELAQWMERRYSANFTYLDAAGDPPDLPFERSPRSANEPLAFDLSLTNTTANTFTLNAEATALIGGNVCDDMTLTHQGTRGGNWPG